MSQTPIVIVEGAWLLFAMMSQTLVVTLYRLLLCIEFCYSFLLRRHKHRLHYVKDLL